VCLAYKLAAVSSLSGEGEGSANKIKIQNTN